MEDLAITDLSCSFCSSFSTTNKMEISSYDQLILETANEALTTNNHITWKYQLINWFAVFFKLITGFLKIPVDLQFLLPTVL